MSSKSIHEKTQNKKGTNFSGLYQQKPMGMTVAKAASRLEEEGSNELEKAKPPTLLILFIVQLLNVLMLMLIFSSVASLIISAAGEHRDDALEYIEGTVILLYSPS